MQPDPFDVLWQLAALQDLVVAPDVDQVARCLREPLEQYAELEFRSDGERIDLITLSDDPHAVDAFMAILCERGCSDEERAAPQALLRFAAGKVVGLKLPVAGPTAGGEVYVRGALPLPEVIYFMARHGVLPEARGQVKALGALLDKGHTHMLGADVALPAAFSFFLTMYLVPDGEQDDEDRVRQALQEVGIPDERIAAFMPVHRLLGADRPKTLFLSWRTVEGKPARQIKVDYADVRLGLLCEAMDAVGATEQAHLPIEWGRHLGLRKANYAGVIVDACGPVAVRAYFTRLSGRAPGVA